MKNQLSSKLCALMLLLGAAALTTTLSAATVTVTNKNDDGAGSLRVAVDSASSGDTIVFASGITGTITLTSGRILIEDIDLTIQGPGASTLTIAGNGDSAVFDVETEGTNTVAISGLTITSGSPGIMNEFTTLTISNCVVTANTVAGFFGGGIQNRFGALTIRSSTISNNSVTGESASGLGGGIANGNLQSSAANSEKGTPSTNFTPSTVTLTDCTLTGNNADQAGGAIYNSFGGTVTMERCTISNNNAGSLALATDGTLFAEGGGIANDGTVTLSNCTITGNTCTGTTETGFSTAGPQDAEGGGIFNDGSVTLTFCTVADNTTVVGTFDDEGGNPEITGGTGGGIATAGLPPQLSNRVRSLLGGRPNAVAIGNVGGTDNIIAGNAASVGPDVDGTFASSGYNLIGDITDTVVTATTGDQFGTGAAPIDPKLALLADNGGPTKTMALLTGSPAIDKGAAVSGVTVDERGITRPQDQPNIANATGGDGSDIGAFELAVAAPTPTPEPNPPLRNLSTRAHVMGGSQIAIGGFIITGSGSRQVLIRGIGPSLPASVDQRLADPMLTLYNDTTNPSVPIATNDNWKSSQETAIEATGLAPTNDNESAILMTLASGLYTAHLSGKGTSTGVGLVEIYDLGTGNESELANLSTRAMVETGDNVVIGGVIIGGASAAAILVDARGPSIGMTGTLPDPTLALYDKDGNEVASNDDFATDAQHSHIPATISSKYNARDSALYRVLNPGHYTAVVRGKNNQTGLALVEIFHILTD